MLFDLEIDCHDAFIEPPVADDLLFDELSYKRLILNNFLSFYIDDLPVKEFMCHKLEIFNMNAIVYAVCYTNRIDMHKITTFEDFYDILVGFMLLSSKYLIDLCVYNEIFAKSLGQDITQMNYNEGKAASLLEYQLDISENEYSNILNQLLLIQNKSVIE